MKKRKIVFVAGARPNFMKIAPILKAFKLLNDQFLEIGYELEVFVVHTGQHYDENMSAIFFQELDIDKPRYNLGVGSGSHAQQTARVMVAFEKILQVEKPHVVVVVGDVNSTIACSLTSKKLNIPVAHVEAGLRSFDDSMPEEINRKLTDAISDYLFVTEQSGINNLKNEGINKNNIYFVGNVMIDTLLENLQKINDGSYVPQNAIMKWVEKRPFYGVLTLHRPSNVDNESVLRGIIGSIIKINKELPIIFPIHPRTAQKIDEYELSYDGIKTIEPVGYMDMLYLASRAKLVITDSGGLQEETTALGISCITIRDNTERPSTIDIGTNYLVGTLAENIEATASLVISGQGKKGAIPPLWDGKASERIVSKFIDIFKD